MPNVDFTEQIENFRSAKYGEEVRESLIDIAEALEDTANNQIVTAEYNSSDESVLISTPQVAASVPTMLNFERELSDVKSALTASDLETAKVNAELGYVIDPYLEQGALASNGTVTSVNYEVAVRSSRFIPLLNDTEYSMKLTGTANRGFIFYYDSNYGYISNVWNKNTDLTFTLPSNARYVKFMFGASNNGNITPSEVVAYAYITGQLETINTNVSALQLDSKGVYGGSENLVFEQGAIGGTGSAFSSSTDIRTSFIELVSNAVYSVQVNGKHVYILFYDSNKAWVSGNIWNKTSDFSFAPSSEKKYLRMVVNNGDSSAIVPADNTVTMSLVGINSEIAEARGSYASLGERLDSMNTDVHGWGFQNGIKFISKAGEGLGVPPESLVSIREVFKNYYDGYRINVCKTSDGYYVCSHDRSINRIARNTDGTSISSTVNIDEHTLAELNAYDFGIAYGSQYAGTEIAQLSDAVKLCSKLGLKVNIEWKYPTITQEDADAIYSIMVCNGFSNKNWRWIASNETVVGYFKETCDYVDIAVLISSASINYYMPLIQSAISDKHDVVVGYSDANLVQSQILQLRKLNITQNKGTATNITQAIEQIESGVTEIECNFPNPKLAMINYALAN